MFKLRFDWYIRMCSFFTLQCKRMYFQSTKLTNILFWRDIHSFVSIRSQPNIRALICVYNRIGRTQLGDYLFSDSKVSGTIAHKTDSLHVHVFSLRPVCAINFSRDQSSAKLINFLDSRLETRCSKLSRIEYRVSRLEDQGSRDCQLTFERYCTCVCKNQSNCACKCNNIHIYLIAFWFIVLECITV